MSLFHKGTTELKLYSTRTTWRFFLPDYSVCLPVLSLCKPWDGTLYIDLRSLRARHEDWIFIKQFSNYKSFLCLLVKNFRNYFNWRKFLKNFVIRGTSLRVEGVEESGPLNTNLPLFSLGGSSRPLMRYIDLHIGKKIQRFDLYIKNSRHLLCVENV